MIAKVRERLAVAKQAAQRFDRQRFNLRKLNEPEVREQYQIEITNRFVCKNELNCEYCNIILSRNNKAPG